MMLWKLCLGRVLGEGAKWSHHVRNGSIEPRPTHKKHFLIPLFWDSECVSAAGHQQLTEWDRTQSVMVSHCHFQSARHGTTACSFQEADKASIVSRLSLYWPLGFYWPLSHWEVYHHRSIQWVALSAAVLQFCRFGHMNFTLYSASTINLCLLLC